MNCLTDPFASMPEIATQPTKGETTARSWTRHWKFPANSSHLLQLHCHQSCVNNCVNGEAALNVFSDTKSMPSPSSSHSTSSCCLASLSHSTAAPIHRRSHVFADFSLLTILCWGPNVFLWHFAKITKIMLRRRYSGGVEYSWRLFGSSKVNRLASRALCPVFF